MDICLLSETHCTSRSPLRVPGYVSHRTDHPDDSAHGGTAVLVRQQLSHHPLPPICTESLQSTSISVNTFHFPLSLSAVYCPPNKPLTEALLLNHFQSLGPRFVSGGDYNAKHPRWGSRLANPRGRLLNHILNSKHFNFIAPPTYTYWPTDVSRLPDLLDFFVSSGIGWVHSAASALPDLSSDHSPVLLTLQLSTITLPKPPSLTPGPTNWSKFQVLLDSKIDLHVKLKTPDDIDSAVQHITEMIQQSAWESSEPRRPNPLNTFPFYLPQQIRLLITAKRRARAAWQRSRYPSDHLKFKRLSHQLRSELSSLRSDRFEKYVSSLSTQDRSLWAATKRLLHFHSVSPPLRRSDGSWARSREEKAEEFASQLRNTFQPHPYINDPINDNLVSEYLQSPLQLSPPPRAVSPADVIHIIDHLPLRKAPGFDLVTAEVLRHLPRKAFIFLTYIFNSIFRTTYFPLVWKFSLIILIPKPNKPATDPTSYRPISLLPLFSKIFEKILLKRLSPIFDLQKTLPFHQFGFRSLHSTVQQCFRIVDTVSSSLERGQYCGGVFLDVAQAFDRVWHPGLLFKLKHVLPDTYYLILKSYLEDRFSRVTEGGALSAYFPVGASVPQGSVLGPFLYTVYASDLPTHPDTLLATFADDTCILACNPNPESTSHTLQEHLSCIQSWCRRWRVKVNGGKSAHVTFTLRRRPCPPVFFDNVAIPSPEQVRYLGLHLDRRLTWNPHTRLKRTDLDRKFGLLSPLLGKGSKLSIDNKLTIYRTILMPSWTYAIEVWGSTKASNIARIQRFQSKVLRSILDAPWYVSNHTIHTDLNIPMIREVVKSRFLKFHSKLSLHPNPLVQALSTAHHPLNPPRRLSRQWPRDLLRE